MLPLGREAGAGAENWGRAEFLQKQKQNKTKTQRGKLALLLEHETMESFLEIKSTLSNGYSNGSGPRSCRVTEPQPRSGHDGAGSRSAAGPCPPAGPASPTAPPRSAAPTLSFPAWRSAESQDPRPSARRAASCGGSVCGKAEPVEEAVHQREEPFCSVNNCSIYNWLQSFTFFLARWTYEAVTAHHTLPQERGFILRSEPSVGGGAGVSPTQPGSSHAGP